MFDKRLLFIVAGLLVILYLVLSKSNPEVVRVARERVVAVATGKPPEGASPAPPDAGAGDAAFEKPRKEVLATRVAESKRRALAKYPDIAVANSEMNSRFVFRYKWMVKENSERLQNPNWPEMLADDCAAAASGHAGTPAGKARAVVTR